MYYTVIKHNGHLRTRGKCRCCRSFCSLGWFVSKPDQFVSTQVSLGQVQNTGHKSQVIVLPIQKQPLPFINANIRPKNFCLGLRLALMNVEDTFCIGKTMTCDLCFVPAPNWPWLKQTDPGWKKLTWVETNWHGLKRIALVWKRINLKVQSDLQHRQHEP